MSTATKWVLLATALFAGGAILWRARRSSPPPESPQTTEQSSARFSFEEAGERLGLSFRHDPGRPTFFYPEIMGAGLAVADFNRDGRLDILLRGGRPGKGHPHHAPGPTTALFLQQSDGTFADASKRSGINDDGYGMGVAVADVNNDGVSDVYLCNFGEDRLYLGKGDGTFDDATKRAGVANKGFSSSASFVDFDRDGRLDLYVCNYVHYPRYVECNAMGRRDYCHPRTFQGLPHKLYRNTTPPGAGPADVRFDDVSEKSGVARKAARGLGVILCDANDDGWPDLFVANDDEPNFLWMNQKDGTFVEAAAAQGVAVNAAGQPQGSMGLVDADFDGDGTLDLGVTNFRAEYTTLYCRHGDGFKDRSAVLGVTLLTRPYTGFGVAAVDLDCDGADELIQVNGRVTQLESNPGVLPPTDLDDAEGVRRFWQAYAEPSQVLRRVGGRYGDVTDQSRDFGAWTGIGRGMSTGDLDGDGRPDLAVLDFAGRAKLFLNRVERRGRWISIRAVDPAKGGRDMLGALVTATVNGKRLSKRVRTCGSYQAASEPAAFFGLGETATVERVEVVWPDGDLIPEAFTIPELDKTYTLERRKGTTKR